MLDRDFNSISFTDIQELQNSSVKEGKEIDYKLILEFTPDEKKKEFLYDISSFANSEGGFIIFGVKEEAGLIAEIPGIDCSNTDSEILKIESTIRDGIEPHITFRTRFINIPSSDKYIAIIKIEKSWNPPHWVSFKWSHRFYGRSSAGKYEFDLPELRNTFTLSESLNDKITDFRDTRISKIVTNVSGLHPSYKRILALHLIPLHAFSKNSFVDIEIAKNDMELKPISTNGWDSRYNSEGILKYSKDRGNDILSYVQVFRNGIIEAVDGLVLGSDSETIPSNYLEEKLIDILPIYLELFNKFNITPPILLFLTLSGIKGLTIAVRVAPHIIHHIDSDLLAIPDLLINDLSEPAHKILKPAFDLIWNACGYPRSYNYDNEGNWKRS